MTTRQFWIGSSGPYYYDDAFPPLYDPEGILPPGQMQAPIIGEGPLVSLTAPSADDDVVRKSDLDALMAFVGDGVAGRVFRHSAVIIQDGTAANTLKITFTDVWNSVSLPAVDNIAKSSAGTWYDLDASGSYLVIHSGALIDVIAVLACWVRQNASGTAICANADRSSGDIVIRFTNATTGVNYDLTAAVDVGDLSLKLTYLTDS